MRFGAALRASTATAAISATLLLSPLIPQVSATPTAELIGREPQPTVAFVRRGDDVGSSCDKEGQWNCMTNSWQRCAAGRWSKEFETVDGTICSPSGYTDEMKIQDRDGKERDVKEEDKETTKEKKDDSGAGSKGYLSEAVMLTWIGFWLFWISDTMEE